MLGHFIMYAILLISFFCGVKFLLSKENNTDDRILGLVIMIISAIAVIMLVNN